MPTHITYTHNPQDRYYINEWYSQFANDAIINPIPGWGYFIHRQKEDTIINIPKTPYDGDVFGIVEVTPKNKLATLSGKIYLNNTYTNNETAKISYYNNTYENGETIELVYTNSLQQIFLYNDREKTWFCSFVKIDTFVDTPIDGNVLPYIFYGTCTTRPDYENKEAIIDDEKFVHGIGASIRITFSFRNGVDNPTLNVNGAGAYPLMYTQENHILSGQWLDGQTLDLFFDGNFWVVVDAIPSTAIHASSGTGGTSGNNTVIDREEIIDIIEEYIEENPPSNINEEQLATIIEEYLKNNNISVDKQTVKNIVLEMVRLGEIGNSNLDESEVNQIIENYLNSHDIVGSANNFFYGTCSTAQDQKIKIIELVGFNSSSFSLNAGVSIRVKFTNTTTSTGSILNVNSQGERKVVVNSLTNIDISSNLWYAGEIVDFIYDGVNWIVVDGLLRDSMSNIISTITGTVTAEVLASDDFNTSVNAAIQAAIQGDVENMIDNKTAATIDEMTTFVNGKIDELNDSFNDTITNLNTDIQTKTNVLQTNITNTTNNLQTQITTSINDLQSQITNSINTIGSNIQQIIDTTFNETIDDKIQDRFTNVIQGQINDAKSALQTEIQSTVSGLRDAITQSNEDLTQQIETTVNTLTTDIGTRLDGIRSEVQDMIDTTFSTTIDEKIDAAFGATIDEKIRYAFEGAEGTLNTAIAESYRKLSEDTTRIETDLNNRVNAIQTQVSNTLSQFEANLITIINEQFQSVIDQKMEETFDAKVEAKVTAMFSQIIQAQVDAAIDDLEATLKASLKTTENELKARIKTLEDGIDEKINTSYENKVQKTVNDLRTELTNLINTRVKAAEDTIDEKINTKFESTIDTLMENKFSAMIDQKIEAAFDEQIDEKITAAKTEIEDGLNARIDARIQIAINGPITTLINTKLEEYVAPAIGATY